MKNYFCLKFLFHFLLAFFCLFISTIVLAASGFGFPSSPRGEKNIDVSQGLGQSHHLEGLAFELPGFLRSLKERLYI